MPIYQADLYHHNRQRHESPDPIDIEQPLKIRRLSEESLRTELCEGPIPDSPTPSSRPRSRGTDNGTTTSDRGELIERLKRGESPTWVPNRRLGSILHSHANDEAYSGQTPSTPPPATASLLPPAQITPDGPESPSIADPRLRDGLDIERPRSALHSGDFTLDELERGAHLGAQERPTSSGYERRPFHERLSDQTRWAATSPPRDFTPFGFSRSRQRISVPGSAESFQPASSPLSSSYSSFIYHPPTSPLVQSESNEELELSLSTSFDGVDLPSQRSYPRRHTLTSHPSPSASPHGRSLIPPRGPLHRREGSLPYQAHQPRRSLTTGLPFLKPGSSPQTPAFLRSRRQSFGSDSSPLQHASMVGSYEESILRGRMSTNPSKPIDFLAQIGVLGMGNNCKPSLKCPPHVTLPFSAVYYSYNTTPHGRSNADDGPSPYVGQIDLENGLPNLSDESRAKRKAQSRYADRTRGEDVDSVMLGQEDAGGENRRISRSKRRSSSPKAPPGGSYRIPENGQIQIIIKNQNKTAVKLFLVPYDLAGMEPGTKTFIRQRSYSAGPVIDGVNQPDAPVSASENGERPVLRYLVHLHVCSPARGRFYLYKSIRIVFANRVPDDKEKLRNETTWPEPRFTPYKPIRVMHPPLLTATSGPAATLVADKAFRRRSSGYSLGPGHPHFDFGDGMHPITLAMTQPATPAGFGGSGNTLPLDPIPFRLPSRRSERPDSQDTSDVASTVATGIRSPESSSQASRPSTKDSTGAGFDGAGIWSSVARYEKLNKGDLGYGGNAFTAAGQVGSSGGGAEGLLSQRLRSLGVKTPPTNGNAPRDAST